MRNIRNVMLLPWEISILCPLKDDLLLKILGMKCVHNSCQCGQGGRLDGILRVG